MHPEKGGTTPYIITTFVCNNKLKGVYSEDNT